ncbi:hypothetical protein R69776_08225 [Paraburkholderia nemoris]|uniref:Uncharacterized protein n=1 Tax=Paraburkholderia nemoris TaxID=2793076 RepID=A0ABN7N9J9_9BURK|nr:hypothetical protein R69776_08225 [Paraburkholderia nemoris]
MLRDHIELLAYLYADLDERMTVVRTEAFGFGQFVTHELARQVGIERLAVTAPLARVRGDRRFWRVFLRGRAARAECFSFVEQSGLVGIPCFAFRAEQFATVGTQPLLGEVTFCCHEPQGAAQRLLFFAQRAGGIALSEQLFQFVGGDRDLARHAD